MLLSVICAKFYHPMITDKWRHDMQEGYEILDEAELTECVVALTCNKWYLGVAEWCGSQWGENKGQ